MGYVSDIFVTVSHTSKYKFKCEQCGEDSGWLDYTFSERASINEHPDLRGVSDSQIINSKLQKEAYEKVQATIEIRSSNPENYYHLLEDRCPHCKKKQSWGMKKSSSMTIFLVILSIFIIVFNIVNINMGVSFKWMIIFGVLLLLSTIISRTVNFIKIKNIANKQFPTVIW